MTRESYLLGLAEACRSVINDTVSGISVCTTYEDATLIGFMQLHRLCGVRLLMLQLAESIGCERESEQIFDIYFRQLEDIKSGSRSLMGVNYGQPQTGPATTAAV
jgi:hypothetical protein